MLSQMIALACMYSMINRLTAGVLYYIGATKYHTGVIARAA